MRTAEGYKTHQRTVIEKLLKENSNIHLTAYEITEKLSQTGESVGTVTVYRTLEKLVSEGKVRKFTADKKDSACFQYIDNKEACREHFHLKCVDCGELLHLDCEKVSNLMSHISREHGFALNTSRTVLYGTCSKCQTKG